MHQIYSTYFSICSTLHIYHILVFTPGVFVFSITISFLCVKGKCIYLCKVIHMLNNTKYGFSRKLHAYLTIYSCKYERKLIYNIISICLFFKWSRNNLIRRYTITMTIYIYIYKSS